MKIRPATPEDVEQVLPLVKKIIALHAGWDSARFAPLNEIEQRYRGWLEARCGDRTSVFLVAEQQGAVIAFLVATTEQSIPIYALPQFGFIHDVWVEPDYRNEGLAKSMTLLALERLKSIGVTQVRLETAVANEVGRSLFTACGFRASTVEMLCEL